MGWLFKINRFKIMALNQQQIQQVETVLRNSLRHKFQN